MIYSEVKYSGIHLSDIEEIIPTTEEKFYDNLFRESEVEKVRLMTLFKKQGHIIIHPYQYQSTQMAPSYIMFNEELDLKYSKFMHIKIINHMKSHIRDYKLKKILNDIL